MITFVLVLSLICILLGLGFSIAGIVLGTVFWVAFKLPFAIICFVLGILCCCTLILIPLGIALFGLGIKVLIPKRKHCIV